MAYGIKIYSVFFLGVIEPKRIRIIISTCGMINGDANHLSSTVQGATSSNLRSPPLIRSRKDRSRRGQMGERRCPPQLPITARRRTHANNFDQPEKFSRASAVAEARVRFGKGDPAATLAKYNQPRGRRGLTAEWAAWRARVFGTPRRPRCPQQKPPAR